MARKAKSTTRTTLRFIAPDDGAIGLEGQELIEAYGKYMTELDENHLNLIAGETPSFYHFKILPFDLQTRIREILTVDGEDEVDAVSMFAAPAAQEVLAEFLDRCLIGADSHPYVDNIRPDGSFDGGVVSWAAPAARPPELTALILAESSLAINMFWFVFRASQLTENEKKR